MRRPKLTSQDIEPLKRLTLAARLKEWAPADKQAEKLARIEELRLVVLVIFLTYIVCDGFTEVFSEPSRT